MLCAGDYGAIGEGSCGPAGIEVTGNVFLLSQSNFQVPRDYVGVSIGTNNGSVPETSITGGPLGHFTFIAGTDLALYLRQVRTKNAPPVPVYCLPVKSPKAIRIHGDLATLYECADSSDSRGGLELYMGHTLLVWNDAGMTCEVSFHGHSQANVDLDVAEAKATVLVSPRRKS
jgi:hypothetical protein